MTSDQDKGRTPISISRQTKNSLLLLKRKGQSYDGLVQELVEFWKEKRGEYWTRRREKRRGSVVKVH